MAKEDWRYWLDSNRIHLSDTYYLTGGNPDGSGGGIIATSDSWFRMADQKVFAVNYRFTNTRIVAATELDKEFSGKVEDSNETYMDSTDIILDELLKRRGL